MTCKYQNEEFCPDDCTNDWCKCSICKGYIESAGIGEINGYIISTAMITCDDWDTQDYKMQICKSCFKKIEESKKRKGNHGVPK